MATAGAEGFSAGYGGCALETPMMAAAPVGSHYIPLTELFTGVQKPRPHPGSPPEYLSSSPEAVTFCTVLASVKECCVA